MTGIIGVAFSTTLRILAELFEKVCARTFLRFTCIGYVPGFAGLVVELIYLPGDSSRAMRILQSIPIETSVNPGSASIVNTMPVPVSTSRLGKTEIL